MRNKQDKTWWIIYVLETRGEKKNEGSRLETNTRNPSPKLVGKVVGHIPLPNFVENNYSHYSFGKR